jgi:iron complex outermembrane recepter protein
MRFLYMKNFAACAAIGCGTVLPALVMGADEVTRLDEVVVTAQKRVQGANDVGITLNAFTGDQLAARGVATSEDVALFTPGLTVNETAATGVPLYTIRGVGFQDYSTAASSTVGLYFDEIAMPYTVMSRGAVFDIERVEVLKGPQGTLYGRNTTGGQINYISKLPTKSLTGGIKASYGSFKTFDAEGYVSGPLSDNWRGRLAFTTTQSSEGWQRSRTRDDKLGKKDVVAIRGLLQGDIGPVDALLRIQYVKDDSDNKANTAYDGRIVGLPEFALPYKGLLAVLGTGNAPWYSTGDSRAADWTNSFTDPNGVTYNLRPRRNNDLTSVSLKLNWKLNDDLTLTSVSGYDKFKRNETNDWDGMAINDSSNINTSDIKVFSQELRVSGQSSTLNWVGGVYYSDDKVDEFYNYFMSESLFGLGSVEFNAAPFVFSPILQLHTRYNQKTTSAAAFGHVEYKVTDRFRLTGGLRYTDEKRRWSGCTFDAGEGTLAGFLNFAFGSNLAPGDCGTIDDDPNSPTYIFGLFGSPNINDAFHVYNETLRAKKWMYKLGLDYKVTPDMLAYATYSRGFKSGGFNGANSNTTQQLKGYRPEQLDSLELGLKSSLLEHRMQLNLAAFYYDYKDKQEQDLAVTFVGNISGLTNVPKSRIIGAEADLQWTPVKGLLFNLGAAWLDTKVKEWMAVADIPNQWPTVNRFDASGIELPQSPKMQVNGGIEYEQEIAGNYKLRMGLDGNYKGSTTGGAKGIRDATDSYTVLNARIGLGSAIDTWMVTLWARNLTDEYYFPAAYQGGNGPWVRSVGMPRTVGVTAEYKF